MVAHSVTGGNVGDPDLPTYEQVKAWLDTRPVCLDGVVNCIVKHRKPGEPGQRRSHLVVEICYFGEYE